MTEHEYRALAREAMKWADSAGSDRERTAFLELARAWWRASFRVGR